MTEPASPASSEAAPSTPPAAHWDPPAYAAAAAALLGLSLDPAWIAPIAANLRVLAAAAALVEGFALPDAAEAAPVFEA